MIIIYKSEFTVYHQLVRKTGPPQVDSSPFSVRKLLNFTTFLLYIKTKTSSETNVHLHIVLSLALEFNGPDLSILSL